MKPKTGSDTSIPLMCINVKEKEGDLREMSPEETKTKLADDPP